MLPLRRLTSSLFLIFTVITGFLLRSTTLPIDGGGRIGVEGFRIPSPPLLGPGCTRNLRCRTKKKKRKQRLPQNLLVCTKKKTATEESSSPEATTAILVATKKETKTETIPRWDHGVGGRNNTVGGCRRIRSRCGDCHDRGGHGLPTTPSNVGRRSVYYLHATSHFLAGTNDGRDGRDKWLRLGIGETLSIRWCEYSHYCTDP